VREGCVMVYRLGWPGHACYAEQDRLVAEL
jgi:hypothetical protein